MRQGEAALTPLAFRRLLSWLDDGVDSHGERYVEMRRRLVSYFDRRDRWAAEELADETLNRVARTLEAGAVAVTPPARYCYVMARFILLEDVRRSRRQVPMDESWQAAAGHGRAAAADAARESRDERLDGLERCLLQLKPQRRELILEYYRDSGRRRIDRRRALAQRLGISMNALAIRACRIRDALMACVETRQI